MIRSITNDDIEQFEKNFGSYIQEGNVFFGAYSLLSILYIFNAKKILKKYQSILIENYNKESIFFDEELLVDEQFSNIAKSNYRVYKKAKIVSPVEVLVLKGNYKQAIKLSKTLMLNIEQRSRLNKIVDSWDSAKIEVTNIIQRSPMEKVKYDLLRSKKLIYSAISLVVLLCVMIILGTSYKTISVFVNGELRYSYSVFSYKSVLDDNDSIQNMYTSYFYDELGQEVPRYVIEGPYTSINYTDKYKNFDDKNIDLYYKLINNEEQQVKIYVDNELVLIKYEQLSEDSLRSMLNDMYYGYELGDFYTQNNNIVKNNFEPGKYFIKKTLYGEGTETNPYKIYTYSQLSYLNNSDKFYQIMNDLYITADITIENFNGVLNGNNKRISSSCTIFSCLQNNSKIYDLNININSNKNILNTQNFGYFCHTNYGIIENVDVTLDAQGIIDIDADMVIGGFVGVNYGIVSNCTAKGRIQLSNLRKYKDDAYLGCFVGGNFNTIKECENNITANTDVVDIGGICGVNYSNSIIQNCINNEELISTSTNHEWAITIGGIAARNDGNVFYCCNNGDLNISSTNDDNSAYVGGIVGNMKDSGKICYCINNGYIEVNNVKGLISAGGICGVTALSTAVISNSISYGNISVFAINNSAYAGGIIGYNYGEVFNCLSEGKISANNSGAYYSFTGGIAGISKSKISNCISIAICYNADFNSGIASWRGTGNHNFTGNFWLKTLYVNTQYGAGVADDYNDDDTLGIGYTKASQLRALELYATITGGFDNGI